MPKWKVVIKSGLFVMTCPNSFADNFLSSSMSPSKSTCKLKSHIEIADIVLIAQYAELNFNKIAKNFEWDFPTLEKHAS